jgi:hypothetical protein
VSDIVHCHSAFRYAEKPVSFNHEGRTHHINQILAQWKTEKGYLFKVLAEEIHPYQLYYDEILDEWQIIPLTQ